MNKRVLTCDAVAEVLSDYLEETVDASATSAVDEHLESCAGCAALLRELKQIAAESSVLADVAPERDLWPGILSRIEAPVVSIETASFRPARVRTPVWLSAAAALVVVTAGVTYLVTTHLSGSAGVALGPPTAVSELRLAADAPSAPELAYVPEIARLRDIVSSRRAELDSATVAVIERNLAIIDEAIAESKAALARDPASLFLSDQLMNSLGKKVELLRTLAMMPSQT
jgi:hypothetical protein